jgi:hypothetical protein
VFELQIILFLLLFSFLLVLTAPVTYMYTSILSWNFGEDDTWARSVLQFIGLFIKVFSFYLIVPILAASVGYLYYTLEEIYSATNLKESISKIGTRTSKPSKR